MNEQMVREPTKLSRKVILEIIVFVTIFGLAVAGLAALIGHYFHPASNPVIQKLLTNPSQALIIYFFFVMIASVIVPIPTLPVDVILFAILDPWSIIVVRLFGGLAGGSVSFYLARRYGRPLLQKWLSKKNYDFVINLSTNITWQHFLVVTMIPVINTELMAYVGGISKMRLRLTLLILALAIFYRLLFVYFVIHA